MIFIGDNSLTKKDFKNSIILHVSINKTNDSSQHILEIIEEVIFKLRKEVDHYEGNPLASLILISKTTDSY